MAYVVDSIESRNRREVRVILFFTHLAVVKSVLIGTGRTLIGDNYCTILITCTIRMVNGSEDPMMRGKLNGD